MLSPSLQRVPVGTPLFTHTDHQPTVDQVPDRLINRDLSLVEFFRRVLEEALDETQPILERLKFISIFSSNLDEFFMIRVSALKEQLDEQMVSPDGFATVELLGEIRRRVSEMLRTQMDCFNNQILPELKENGISVVEFASLAANEREAMSRYFREHIYPVLTPQAVDPSHPFPYISGGSLNLGLFVRPTIGGRVRRALKAAGGELFVRLKIPPFVDRLLPFNGEGDRFVLIEDLIRTHIRMLMPDATPEDCFAFRITRDADIEMREEEAHDLLTMMEDNLRQRRFGDVVRLEIVDQMPKEMEEYLTSSLEIGADDVYRIEGPLDLTGFGRICKLNRPDLTDIPLKIARPAEFTTGESIFEIIKRGDVMLHHPYMSYDIVTDFIRESAEDPDVLAIKICLYRMGPLSPIPPLLMRASELGKQVTVLIEIKARFDEENNIEWAKKLERAGVHVIYGLLGLKTHAKATLIIRREEDRLQRYIHLATGNYNPQTSAVYTDLGLLTIDPQIGEDTVELFNFLTAYSYKEDFHKLLVAPANLRERMIELIGRETENARKGRPAKIIAKINRLADAEIVDALYFASQAGVQIDMIIRGICTLRPGVPGLSDNIRVRSVVGRLLEHSRVYYFENGGDPELYVGSSDWMPRNLDRRVEVLTPIAVPKLKEFLMNEYLTTYLRDNMRARELTSDGTYFRVRPNGSEDEFDCQLAFQEATTNVVEFETRN
jgi:polyphosphate kinase